MQTIKTNDGQEVMLDLDITNVSPEQTLMLATAIVDVLVRSGRVRTDVALTGPHLLQFMSELGDELSAAPEADLDRD